MDKPNKIRLWEIDSLRGLAVVGMIVFHVFYILNFFDVVKNEMYEGGWFWLVRFVQLMFLGLVGVSMALSKSGYRKQFVRGAKVFFMGIGVSIVTYFFEPELFVKFGILHLIGVSIILLVAISGRKYLSLFCGILVLLIWQFVDFGTSSNLILHILGLGNTSLYALDYFPIFPWISVILFGIFIGNFLREFVEKKQKKSLSVPKIFFPLVWLGQNSLLIYMIHIPAIIAVLIVFKIVPMEILFTTGV
jgi:uncharacterized membrane protein